VFVTHSDLTLSVSGTLPAADPLKKFNHHDGFVGGKRYSYFAIALHS
jgi:hypothetical protein